MINIPKFWKRKVTKAPSIDTDLAKSLVEKDKPRKLKLLRFNYTRWRPQPKPLRYRSITKNHEVYKNILKEREK